MALSVKRMAVAGVVVGALALAAGCSSSDSGSSGASGGGNAGTDITFQLNNPPNGSNAGFASAVQQGYYKDAGINATIVPGTGSSLNAQIGASRHGKIGYTDSTPPPPPLP